MKTSTLTPELLGRIDAHWRAANCLSVGQIYLCENPLLKRPLALKDVKHMLLGHRGTTPGQNFIYVHLNRIIEKSDLDMIYVSGPGHGGPAVVGNTYLEGAYSEIHPDISQDEAGLRKLFLQFSFPGGIPSHASPECPGSIHEGGALGYSLSHSFGAVFDNPDLVVACVIGDEEAETGPLATAWHSNKFLDPATDGAALPILHLNGYKISNPTVLARITREELEQLLRGYGWTPLFVEGHEPAPMHQAMAAPGAAHAPVTQRLLPLDESWRRKLAELPWPTGNLPEVMGGGTATLRALIREYLFVSLFRACAESLASENASRLAAMERADKNIDELLENLRRRFHRLRQEGIDEEFFDVIAGFEAVSG